MLNFVLEREPRVGEQVAGYKVNVVSPAHGRLSLTTSDGVRVWANYAVVSPSGRQMGFQFDGVEAPVVEVFH